MFQTTNQLFIIIPTDLQFFLHLQLLLELLELLYRHQHRFLGHGQQKPERIDVKARLQAMKYS